MCLLPVFITEGKAKFQLEVSESNDHFSLAMFKDPKLRTPGLEYV